MAEAASPAALLIHSRPRAGVWNASLAVLAAALLCFVLLPTRSDPDLWGHLRYGLDMLESHSLPRVDSYSFTAHGAAWTNHEWLAELLFALAWRAGGAAGLIALKVGIGLLTGILCYWHVRRVAVLVVLLPLLPPFMMLRPLLFTIPAFAATLIVLSRGGRALWILPPLFAVWANLHGGFLAGLAFVAAWAVFARSTKIVLPIAAAFAAVCVNPYGWRLIEFLVRTASVPRPEIMEWAPLQVSSTYGMMYAAVLAVSVAALVYSRSEKSWPLLALFGIAALLPFVAMRHTPLFAVAAAVLVGPHMDDLLRKIQPLSFPGWASALPLVCAGVLVFAAIRKAPQITVPENMPVKAVQLLAASGVEGNLIHRFNWGEYVLWQLAPRVKVMMDGRRETVYPNDVYTRYLDFQAGTGDWESVYRGYTADVALLEENSVSANLFRLKPDWVAAYADDVAEIFVRRGSESARRLKAAALQPAAPPYYFP